MSFGGSPFAHFESHHRENSRDDGGRARGRGGHDVGEEEDEVDTRTQLYEALLGIHKSATPQEIKAAYRNLALIHHPDKGGDERVFKTISSAYQILSDVDLRRTYDLYGLDGVRNHHHHHHEGEANSTTQGGPTARDLFDVLFGGSSRAWDSTSFSSPHRRRHDNSRPRPRRSRSRGDDAQYPLQVTLEDLYRGRTFQVAINRTAIVAGSSRT